jgi:hypothetical protein
MYNSHSGALRAVTSNRSHERAIGELGLSGSWRFGWSGGFRRVHWPDHAHDSLPQDRFAAKIVSTLRSCLVSNNSGAIDQYNLRNHKAIGGAIAQK